ncbi:LysR family transcriptional regulator substrate-binding protein [Streptomyces sp. NPDC088812]|uniref:LysR family transcriptional regulator substrate-binding protein n=1 Tax=Streptomyces sp. NPDC088812 TaxID=3365905 RepID=UPI00382D78F1
MVTLGSYPSPSAAFVPRVLAALARTDPDIQVILSDHSIPVLDEAFTAGKIDVCLRPLTPPPVSQSLRHRVLWREPLVIVHPLGHPLAALADPLPAAAVAEYPVITIGRAEDMAFEWYKLFRDRGQDLQPVHTTNQPQTVIGLVRENLGVGIVNALAANVSDTTGVAVRRLEGDCGRKVAAFWDTSRALTPAARTLFRLLGSTTIPDGTEPPPAQDTADTP